MRPACDTCPFRAEGIFELPLHEDPSLTSGKTMLTTGDPTLDTVITNEDGTITTMCPHNAFFMADPNSAAIVQQQAAEMQLNAMVAAQALAEAVEAGNSDTGGTD